MYVTTPYLQVGIGRCGMLLSLFQPLSQCLWQVISVRKCSHQNLHKHMHVHICIDGSLIACVTPVSFAPLDRDPCFTGPVNDLPLYPTWCIFLAAFFILCSACMCVNNKYRYIFVCSSMNQYICGICVKYRDTKADVRTLRPEQPSKLICTAYLCPSSCGCN